MGRRLYGCWDNIELLKWNEHPPVGYEIVQFHELSARSFLEEIAWDDCFNMNEFRGFLSENGFHDLYCMTDQDVLREIMGLLASGHALVASAPIAFPTGPAAPRLEKAPERPPEKIEDRGDLSLRVVTMTGEPVEDDAGFLLIHPEGTVEPSRLSVNSFRKNSIPAGTYRARFKHLCNARWVASLLLVGEEAAMRVDAPSLDAGTVVTFKVYVHSHSPDAEPVATLHAKVTSGEAVATWRHSQALGTPASEEYLFEAEVGKKWAGSDVLGVEPHPLSDVQGIKERLVQLGYDCGAPGPETTPALERALKDFQANSGFLDPTGRPDEETIAFLGELR